MPFREWGSKFENNRSTLQIALTVILLQCASQGIRLLNMAVGEKNIGLGVIAPLVSNSFSPRRYP